MAGNFLNRAGTLIEELLNGRKTVSIQNSPLTSNNGKQTCLEKMGMVLRKEHIERNPWRREDNEYTKQLVLSEYLIQTEFKVGPDSNVPITTENNAEKTAEKVKKNKTKRKKKDTQEKKPSETIGE